MTRRRGGGTLDWDTQDIEISTEPREGPMPGGYSGHQRVLRSQGGFRATREGLGKFRGLDSQVRTRG